MSLQKKLDPRYHGDRFLTDWFMTALDIPPIQIALRDSIPRTAQQLSSRIANKLCEKTKTAGSPYMSADTERELSLENEVM